ncbi:MAG: polysaccharide deacetylase family protein [Candidatus Azobacteroides sp.]|nr:polysaccharide deacetylase family protein [Candidatus Azobacteroides sp.]
MENIRRLEYSVKHIFNNAPGVDVLIIRDKEIFLRHDGPCINYSDEDLNHGLWIVPHGLLSEKGVREIPNIEVFRWNDYFCFFKQAQGDIPFDPFAASFYLLTLYEEYFPKQSDEHGRFDPKESLAYRNGFLEIPVVDRWAGLLKEELEKRYPDAKFKKRKFRFISTFDIDYPYMYLKKGLLRSLGGMMRDLLNRRRENIASRIAVHLRMKPDPYMEALRWIDRVHKEARKSYYLFVLMKNRGKYGRKTLYPPVAFYRYLKKLDSVTVGLHPSYDTYLNPGQLIREKKRLEKVLGETELIASRQHFLRMHVPETFRNLETAGFKEDFTTAFAHAPGFRSGTAIPYYFYDVKKDTTGKLLLHPTVVMDACLITHLGLSPEEGFEKIKRLIDECKQSGGDFVSLWHNSNLAGADNNNPWINVFIKSFHYAISAEK